jgi:hypothetical protein
MKNQLQSGCLLTFPCDSIFGSIIGVWVISGRHKTLRREKQLSLPKLFPFVNHFVHHAMPKIKLLFLTVLYLSYCYGMGKCHLLNS